MQASCVEHLRPISLSVQPFIKDITGEEEFFQGCLWTFRQQLGMCDGENCGDAEARSRYGFSDTANLLTKIQDFRGFDSSIIVDIEGLDSHVHWEIPTKFESTNLSRDDLSRETGRNRKVPTRGYLFSANPGTGTSYEPLGYTDDNNAKHIYNIIITMMIIQC